MNISSKIAACTLLCMVSLTACQADRIGIPPEEEFTREFIKEFGLVDPNHDWSLIKQGFINISTKAPTNVKIYIIVEGKTRLLADYPAVEGSQTLTFDVVNSAESVLVKAGGFFEEVKIGATINLSSSRGSRAIDGTDQLAVAPQIKNGFSRDYKFVSAFNEVLPEYGDGGRALKNNKISTDFSFVSTGKPFIFYPVYWNTGAKNTLGVYWYENGELKTQDLFNNYNLDDEGTQISHNIYRKATQITKDLEVTSHIPEDKAIDVSLKGDIIVNFDHNIKATQWGRATLRLSSNPTGSQAFLKTIRVEDNKAIFSYEGLAPMTEYVFTIPARRFVPTNEIENTNNYSKEMSFTFTTIDTDLKLYRVSPADDKGSTNRTNGKSGDIVLTYNHDIKIKSGALATMVSVDGKHSAKITGPEISGKTMTYHYSDAEYDTPYDVTIPEGVVCSTELETATNNKRIFRLVTMVDPNEYTYNEEMTNVPLSITKKNETFAKDANIVGTDAPFSACISKDIAITKTVNWTYNGLEHKFIIGIQNKDRKIEPSEAQPLAGGARGDDWKALMLITPTENLRLTVFYGSKKTDKSDTPKIYDQKSFRIFEVDPNPIEIGTDKDSYHYRTCSYELRNGRTYLLYSPEDARVAAFAYQTVKDIITKDEPVYDETHTDFTYTRSRSRAEGDNTPVYDVPTYNSEAEIEAAGYDRVMYPTTTSSYIKHNNDKGGKDNIVTHQISVTLPAGHVFGFYIRNNSGATGLTFPGGGEPKPYYNYSMSSLNEEMTNSFFNSLMDSAQDFANGWKHYDKIDHEVDESRKYSTAATYSVDIDGDEYRYFSFEDWVDCDFNDIVFLVDPQSDDIPVVDMEIETNPCLVAVEDMGAITKSDIDFNDIVFAVEHTKGHKHAFITMLAAGGTYESQLLYNGKVVGKSGADGIGEVVAGPGVGKSLDHVNAWFDEADTETIINVGEGGSNPGFGNLTTVKIEVDENFSMAPRMEFEGAGSAVSDLSGFSVRVQREDGEHTQISRPSGTGQVPQMLVLPMGWYWPKEGVAIQAAFPGGLSADGDRIASFQNWVSNKYETNQNWYLEAADGTIIVNPWNGSDAARDYIRNLMSPAGQAPN